MERAVISGDIIGYTSLKEADKIMVEESLKSLMIDLKAKFNVFARLIKGDYLECYIPQRHQALRVALCIKSLVKSTILSTKSKSKRLEAFTTHGIRLAIGIGAITRFDKRKGIIDGQAIYYSGRIMNESSGTSNKERIVIKNTLFIKSNSSDFDNTMDAMLALLDILLSKATARQCSVLYLKLTGYDENKIASKLGLSQSTVNKHSTSVGWNAIEKAVQWFENELIKTE